MVESIREETPKARHADANPGTATEPAGAVAERGDKKSILQIWKTESGHHYIKDVSIAACPFCHDNELLIVSDVQISGEPPKNYPQAIHCGRCGARGPWAKTEELATIAWNSSQGTSTESLSEWEMIPDYQLTDGDSLPF